MRARNRYPTTPPMDDKRALPCVSRFQRGGLLSDMLCRLQQWLSEDDRGVHAPGEAFHSSALRLRCRDKGDR